MVRNMCKPKLWTQQEDQALKVLVQQFGEKKWKIISQNFNSTLNLSRTSKQCRDRWANYLNGYKTNSFTSQEISNMLHYFDVYGSRWAKISRHLKGRTENQIKNFFYSTIRRNVRKFNKFKLENEKIRFSSVKLLENLEIRHILLAEKTISRNEMAMKTLSKEAKEFRDKFSCLKYTVESLKINADEGFDDSFLYDDHSLSYLDDKNLLQSESLIEDHGYENISLPDYTPILEFEFY
ncbi:hypothetical protein SteCoe_1372 [Stentor coeruleus]|uniref:Myb-like DNA-binding domain containing protein n=1 Tax=Stentor coeruleus TaxID=5963 RepID=A0A1R2D245_9CILI|nr:hypothetical protein SteCoe_1372 [Stentor coeruleus]